MSILKLLDEDPVPEREKEVTLPETPPGLDAIRAWIGKPRPWLHGIRLWIKHILSAGPAAWKLLEEHGPRAARAVRRLLRRIAPVTRPLVEIGEIISELGKLIRRVADELRDILGKQTPTGAQLGGLGRIAQRVGGLIVSTTEILGKALTLLGRLLAVLARLELSPHLPAHASHRPSLIPSRRGVPRTMKAPGKSSPSRSPAPTRPTVPPVARPPNRRLPVPGRARRRRELRSRPLRLRRSSHRNRTPIRARIPARTPRRSRPPIPARPLPRLPRPNPPRPSPPKQSSKRVSKASPPSCAIRSSPSGSARRRTSCVR